MVDVSNLEEIQNLLNDLDNPIGNQKLEKSNSLFTPLAKQAILALGFSTSSMGVGFVAGFTAILFPQLREHNDLDFELNKTTEALIASAPPMAIILGSSIAGFLAHVFGKKYVMCAAFIITFIGWVVLTLAYNFAVLVTSRFILGFGYGMLMSNAGVYIGEMSSPVYRASFLFMAFIFNNIAFILVHSLGIFCPWKLISGCCSIFSLVGLLVLSLYPESPSWLISKGKYDLGIKSYYFIRGYENNEELKQILFGHREKMVHSKDKFKLSYFKRPEIWKPFSIVLFYFITGLFSGFVILVVYAVEIMQSTLGDSINEYLATLIIDVVRLISALIAMLLIKYLNIRTLAMLSGILTTLALGSMSISLYLEKMSFNIPPIFILLLLIIYMFSVNLGISPLPFILVTEVFPAKYRNILTGVCESIASVTLFIVVYSAPYLFEGFGFHGTFLLYCIVTLVSTLFLSVNLPETKGKTLTEIEMSFKNNK